MPEPSTPRIFVSYARSDGKAFARELRRRLGEEHGFSLWHDLADMEGGRDWWRQIEAAIRAVEYLVLVMTPAALRSDYVRREWRLARELGVCVIPVKAAPGLDYSGLPRWMRRAHVVDTETPEQWTRFVRTLEAPCQVPRVPFMAGDPPPDFVPRPEEYKALRDRLLDPERKEPVAITAALRGAGGYGKTTLATALCHDPDVQEAFHDGVLWVTLGEQPGDLTARVEDLIAVLTGERPGFASIEAATARFVEVVADRALFLVIDDVWNAVHLRPFLRGGPNCARLITTRNSDALPAGAREVPVDAMKTAEAADLLRCGLPDGEGAAFDALAARLGEWPLLLKLVNGALRARVNEQRQPLARALDYVNRALDRRGVTAFDARDAASRDQAVARTLAVSLDHLAEDERARFRELAVFPEDIDVPITAVEALWGATAGLDDLDTEDLCGLLHRRSLLLGFDLDARRLRLHDVVRRYLEQQSADRLPALHRHLIESYRARCPDGWWSMPDDGYVFRHLPWHLAQAREEKELHGLLFNARWLRCKLAAASVAEAVADLDFLPGDRQAADLAAALRLSARPLARDPGQLAGQLLGRLGPNDGPAIAYLLADARAHAEVPALLPRRPTLNPPGTPLIQTFTGHTGGVRAVAVLPDGRRALAGSDDGTLGLWDLRLWDLKGGAELRRFTGHTGRVGAVAALADGRRALSGGTDGTLRLWDLEGGAELRRFAVHAGEVRAVAVLPDGRRVLSGGGLGDSERRLYEWGWAVGLGGYCDGDEARLLHIEGGGGDDYLLRLWDLEGGAELRRFPGHIAWVKAVAALPDGRRALSGSDDGTLWLWDLEGGAELRRFKGHTGGVRAVAALPDGRHALAGRRDGTLRLWDLEGGALLAVLTGDARFTCLAPTPDGCEAVAGDAAGNVHLLDILL